MIRLFVCECILATSVSAMSAEPGELDGMLSISGCSGALVQQEGSADLPAIALTAGHCLRSSLLKVGEQLREQEFTRSGLRIYGSGGVVFLEGGISIAFATMSGMDLAILKLPVSQGELAGKGFRFHEIAEELSLARGDSVTVGSGYWLQQRRCEIVSSVALKEGPYEFAGAYALSKGCDAVRPGFSGAGVKDSEGRLLGIVFTTNEASGKKCGLGNPCEVKKKEQISVPGRTYFQNLSVVAPCLTSSKPCRLPHGAELRRFLHDPRGKLPDRIRFLELENGFLDEAAFTRIVYEVTESYRTIAAFHGMGIIATADWKNEDELATAQSGGREWSIRISGALARYPSFNRDSLSLAICHELGHELGGYPFKVDNFEPGDRIHGEAAEGQADYFATHACARQIWGLASKSSDERERLRLEAGLSYSKCEALWESREDRYLCARTLLAIEGIAHFFTGLSGNRVDISTPDSSVAKWSILEEGHYPSFQCRIDTLVAGALCRRPFNSEIIPALGHPRGQESPEAEAEAGKYSCFISDGFAVGTRPLCWYLPKRNLTNRLDARPRGPSFKAPKK